MKGARKQGTKLKSNDDQYDSLQDTQLNNQTPQTYDPTTLENLASRACYTRIFDLLTEFGIVTEKASQTFSGPAGKTFTGIYKAVTRIGLPIWKGVHEANNQPQNHLSTMNKWINALNMLDGVASFFSTIFWLIGTIEDKNPVFFEIEKYLLFSALVFHSIKDTIQLYQKFLKEEQTKKDALKEKQYLKALDDRLSKLEEANKSLREDINKVADDTNISLLKFPGYSLN